MSDILGHGVNIERTNEINGIVPIFFDVQVY